MLLQSERSINAPIGHYLGLNDLTNMKPKLAAFPKCYIDDLCVHQTMTLFDWIGMASTLGVDGLEFDRRIHCRRRQNNFDSLRTFHHMSVGDDVAVRVDNNPCTKGMLPHDASRIGMSVAFRRPIPGDDDLDHGRGDFRDYRLKRTVQSSQ